MDTGTGKTLVAVMLIRHITSLPIQNSIPGVPEPPKLVIFIVPTVSLVYQQAEVLRSQTSLRVKGFSGDMGVDLWKREQWLAELDETDALVCTAQLWLNVLSKAYWSIDRISLLILDECHHATKNNPYARIMKDHYHRVKNDSPGLTLPRILGMTASPIFNPKNPQKALAELENNLHSRVVEAALSDDSLNQFTNKPKERLIEYDAPPEVSIVTEFEDLLHEVTKGTFHITNQSWNKIREVKLSLGTFASNIFIISIVKEILAGSTNFGTPIVDPVPLQNLYDNLVSIHSYQSLPSFTSPQPLNPLISPSYIDIISPQVLTLVNLLLGYRESTNFHAIIFVERRIYAGIISDLLGKVGELKDWIRCGWLVGHGGTKQDEDGEYRGLKVKEQTQTVAKFRSGELNLLVATKVAEEGLDFRACNVVIRFDPLQTITGYIQSRGRARAPDSEFIVLAKKDSDESNTYRNYLAQEPSLKTMYQDRPVEETDEPDLDDLSTYTVNATGAILTHHASIPLLSEFCALLPRDAYSPSVKPIYEITPASSGGFIAKVTLPMIASLPGRTIFYGQPLATKKAAKQSAAFGVCRELHWQDAINDHLFPVREPRGKGAKDVDGNILDPSPTKKSSQVEAKNYFGDFRREDSKVYLHVIDLEDEGKVYSIGLVTGASLEDFEEGEYFESNPSRSVSINLRRIVELKDWNTSGERTRRLAALEGLNRTSARVVLNRKIDKEPFYALWTPLLEDGSIDWHLVESAFSSVPECSSPDLANGKTTILLFCRRGNHHIFKYIETRQDVTTLSSTFSIEGDIANNSRAKLVKRYPIYRIYVKVAFDYMELSETIAEPILTVSPISIYSRNHLLPMEAHEAKETAEESVTSKKFYPASICRVTTLPDSFFEFFSKTPSLLRIIHDIVSTKAAIRQFDFPAIDMKQLIVALTPPSAITGYHYQSLETIGDSALKLATTVHIYLEKPGLDEGQLTNLRQNSVDNKYLNKKCTSSGFSAFILADHFKSTQWIPPTSSEGVSVSSNSQIITRTIGRRALQDTIEATLGAALSSGGIPMVLKTGTQLGLCFGGITPWGQRESAKVLMENGRDVGTAANMKHIEAKLGYKFKNGRLLLQALTHRSYVAAETHCYEREEHLGDALIDYWAISRLLTRFPDATPHSLTYHRAMLVSNPALSLLSIKVLQLHKNVLHTSPLLSNTMTEASLQAEPYSYADVLEDLTWLWSPPKVLGDVFESVIGSLFVDSGFDLELSLGVLDRMYEGIMPFLKERGRADPFSRLVVFGQAIHCRKIQVKATRHATLPIYTTLSTFHSEVLPCTPISSPSRNVSKQLASRIVLEYLDSDDGKDLSKSCCCKEELRKEREEAHEKELEQEREEREKRETEVRNEEEKEEEEEEGEEKDGEEEEVEERAAQRVRIY